MISRSHVQTMLWSAAVAVALAVCFALMLQVKGVKSDIAATERQILSTKQDLMVLETEFQTRARQQQLVRWNEVEFGYVAPKANQFFETRQELAMLGKPVEIIAPAPIRMADAEEMQEGSETVRVAAADTAAGDAPIGMMRQLVARDNIRPSAPRPTASAAKPEFAAVRLEPASLPAIPAARPLPRDAPAASTRNFADRFDLDSVIAQAEGND